MATVNLHYSLTVLDGLQKHKSTDVYLSIDDGTTLAQLAAAYGTWVTDLNAIIDGSPLEGQIRIKPALPGSLNAATGATWLASRNSQTGLIRFQVTGTTAEWSDSIPSFKNAFVVGDTISPTATATYTALLIGGGTGPFGNPENQPLVAVTKYKLTTRRK